MTTDFAAYLADKARDRAGLYPLLRYQFDQKSLRTGLNEVFTQDCIGRLPLDQRQSPGRASPADRPCDPGHGPGLGLRRHPP